MVRLTLSWLAPCRVLFLVRRMGRLMELCAMPREEWYCTCNIVASLIIQQSQQVDHCQVTQVICMHT